LIIALLFAAHESLGDLSGPTVWDSGPANSKILINGA
jgi:hypothetical protein